MLWEFNQSCREPAPSWPGVADWPRCPVDAGEVCGPYSKGQKNDFRNAEAIAEAAQRPTMKFVATTYPHACSARPTAFHRSASRSRERRARRLLTPSRYLLEFKWTGLTARLKQPCHRRYFEQPHIQLVSIRVSSVKCQALRSLMETTMKHAVEAAEECAQITIRELAMICFSVNIIVAFALYWFGMMTSLGCAVVVVYLIASVLLLWLHDRAGNLRF